MLYLIHNMEVVLYRNSDMEVVEGEEITREEEGVVEECTILHVAEFPVEQVQVVRPQKKPRSSFALSDSKC